MVDFVLQNLFCRCEQLVITCQGGRLLCAQCVYLLLIILFLVLSGYRFLAVNSIRETFPSKLLTRFHFKKCPNDPKAHKKRGKSPKTENKYVDQNFVFPSSPPPLYHLSASLFIKLCIKQFKGVPPPAVPAVTCCFSMNNLETQYNKVDSDWTQTLNES